MGKFRSKQLTHSELQENNSDAREIYLPKIYLAFSLVKERLADVFYSDKDK